MKYLEWCVLFEIADAFIDTVSTSRVDKKAAFQTLNALTRYAQEHFSAE